MNLAAIEDLTRQLLIEVGENPDRAGIKETPARVAKAHAELLSGYAMDPQKVLKAFEVEDYTGGGLVVVHDVPFFSLCEHHWLPFRGKVDVGIQYAAGQPIIGLSKVGRLVDVFARRLQVQERLTGQIAEALFGGLKAQGVVVRIRADEHLCIAMRGVCKPGTQTTTQVKLGSFTTDAALLAGFNSLV